RAPSRGPAHAPRQVLLDHVLDLVVQLLDVLAHLLDQVLDALACLLDDALRVEGGALLGRIRAAFAGRVGTIGRGHGRSGPQNAGPMANCGSATSQRGPPLPTSGCRFQVKSIRSGPNGRFSRPPTPST